MFKKFLTALLFVSGIAAAQEKFSLFNRASPTPGGTTGCIVYASTTTSLGCIALGITGYVLTAGSAGPHYAPPTTGVVPTGTGFRYVASGVEADTGKLVDTSDVNNSQITYAKIQDMGASSRLLGRSTTGAGVIEELAVSTGLTLAGGALTVTSPILTTLGGTGTITNMTAGGIVFPGVGGPYTQDATNLFWNDADNRFGIGTATPAGLLSVNLASASGNVSTWDSTYAIFGAAGSAQGKAVGIGYDSVSDFGEIRSIHPGTSWKNLAIRGRNLLFYYQDGAGITQEGMRLVETTGRLGIGTAAPTSRATVSDNTVALPAPPTGTVIHVGGANDTLARFVLDSFGNAQPNITLRRAQGTAALPTAVVSNDILADYAARGRGTTVYSTGAAALIRMSAAQNWTDTAQGSYLTFFTSPNGTNTLTEIVRIDSTGLVGVGTTAPTSRLTASDNAATLPAPTAGTVFHAAAADTINSRFTIDAFGAGVPLFTARAALGTGASPTALALDGGMGGFDWQGRGTTVYSSTARAFIRAAAAEAWTDSAHGTYLRFATTPVGSTTVTEQMRLDAAGRVGIGVTVPVFNLDLKYPVGATDVFGWQYGADAASRNWGLRPDIIEYGDFVIQTSAAKTSGQLNINRWRIGPTGLITHSLAGLSGTSGTLLTTPGTLFTQTANAVTTANNLTTLFGTGVGTLTLATNTLAIGRTIEIEMGGFISAADGGAGTKTLTLSLGGVTIATATSGATFTTVVNNAWRAKASITCRTTGAGGTCIGGASWETQIATANPNGVFAVATATAACNTTGTLVIDLKLNNGNATGTSTTTYASVKILN